MSWSAGVEVAAGTERQRRDRRPDLRGPAAGHRGPRSGLRPLHRLDAGLRKRRHRRDPRHGRLAAYVRQHYLVDSASEADELQKLVWLKEQNAITEEEYEELKQRVMGRDPSKPPPPDYIH